MNKWNVTIVLFSISDYSDLYYDSEDGKLKYMTCRSTLMATLPQNRDGD